MVLSLAETWGKFRKLITSRGVNSFCEACFYAKDILLGYKVNHSLDSALKWFPQMPLECTTILFPSQLFKCPDLFICVALLTHAQRNSVPGHVTLHVWTTVYIWRLGTHSSSWGRYMCFCGYVAALETQKCS